MSDTGEIRMRSIQKEQNNQNFDEKNISKKTEKHFDRRPSYSVVDDLKT